MEGTNDSTPEVRLASTWRDTLMSDQPPPCPLHLKIFDGGTKTDWYYFLVSHLERWPSSIFHSLFKFATRLPTLPQTLLRRSLVPATPPGLHEQWPEPPHLVEKPLKPACLRLRLDARFFAVGDPCL